MNTRGLDLEHVAGTDRERRTQHLELPGADLEQLSISDLERLLAEKRRRESKRMLRAIAGRAAANTAHATALQEPATPVGPAPPARKITRRLFADEARPALNRATPAPARWGAAPPHADRFRRSALAAPVRVRPQRGPAWARPAGVRKGIDLGLQLAEIGFVVLFLYVIAQWLFADSQTDTNIAQEMAAVQVPAAPVVPAGSDADRASYVQRQAPAALPALAPPSSLVLPSNQSPTPSPAQAAASVPNLSQQDSLLEDHFSARLTTQLTKPPPAASQITTTGTSATTTAAPVTAAPPRATAAPVPPNPNAVESNPALPNEIRIPRIQLDARVREVEVSLDTWTWNVADFMAGHHTGTANPGDTGNVVIAGHRDIRGSVFLRLDLLKKGDDVYLYSGHGVFHYIVRTTKIVLPSASQIMAPTTDQRLTLITCTPVKIASHRLVVIADLDTSYVAPAHGR